MVNLEILYEVAVTLIGRKHLPTKLHALRTQRLPSEDPTTNPMADRAGQFGPTPHIPRHSECS